MSRVINTNSPGKIRNRHRRTIAEMLRRLSQKQSVDEESKDMAALIVYLLRELYDSAHQSAQAWEKRDYWVKAERFLQEWRWSLETASDFEDIIRHEAWDLLPELLADLFPRFADIQIKKMMRSPSEWQGAYQKLMTEPPQALPW